jgi:hypothetical protein
MDKMLPNMPQATATVVVTDLNFGAQSLSLRPDAAVQRVPFILGPLKGTAVLNSTPDYSMNVYGVESVSMELRLILDDPETVTFSDILTAFAGAEAIQG